MAAPRVESEVKLWTRAVAKCYSDTSKKALLKHIIREHLRYF